jgi:hypothetical protein
MRLLLGYKMFILRILVNLRRKLKNLIVEGHIVWKGESPRDPLGYYKLKSKNMLHFYLWKATRSPKNV